MSNHTAYGTITTDTTTTEVTCSGWVTLSAHLISGAGTMTWQFKGVDGDWRSIYGSADNITIESYTATNMVNAFFGTDVKVRGNASAGTSPEWDWQIMSNPRNRD